MKRFLIFSFMFFLVLFLNIKVYAVSVPPIPIPNWATQPYYITYYKSLMGNVDIEYATFIEWSNPDYVLKVNTATNEMFFYSKTTGLKLTSVTAYSCIMFVDSNHAITQQDWDVYKASLWHEPSRKSLLPVNNAGIGVSKINTIRGTSPVYTLDNISLYSPVPVASVVKFIQPSVSPFSDTTDGFNFLVSYNLPVGTSVSDVSIKFSSPNIDISSWSITQQEYSVSTGSGWVKVFASPVPIGTHQVNCTINTLSATSTIIRLGGTVDENGDGIDDRTNQPIGDGHVDYEDIKGGDVTKGITALTGFISTMTSFSTKIFSFMPNEVKVIMVFVVSVMGFIAIKKFIL